MARMALKGLYHTFRNRADQSRVYYYYAWKGGPLILKTDRKLVTATPELIRAYQDAHAARAPNADGYIAGLVAQYRQSPEWRALAPRTRADYLRWLDRIAEKFGSMPLEAADDRRVIRHFIAWRDAWAYSPRQADYGVMVLRLLLEWGRTRGLLDFNRADGIGQLYSVDKSGRIWTAADIDAACGHASPEVQRAIVLGANIGFRLADLAGLRWDQVHIDQIVRTTNKGRGKRVARVPLLTEARQVLDACPRVAVTVLTNTRGKPWSASGLSHAITDAAQTAGVDRSTHDLRRTCATRLAAAGFEDQEIADWLGWTVASVKALRRVYVDQNAVILSAIARLKRNES